jgi:hypothetical protein
MSNSTNNFSEKLVQYLDGELTGPEKDAVENQLAGDPALQEELENLELARAAVSSFGLKRQVANVHEEMMGEMSSNVKQMNGSRRIIRYSMSIAAGLVIILAGIMAYDYFSLSGPKLFKENYRNFELATVRGNDSASSAIDEAYRAKKYKEVVMIQPGRPLTIKEKFLRSASYTELGDDEKAIAGYKEILSEDATAGTNELKDETEYYLSLSYLRNKNYTESLALMKNIQADPRHTYHEKITNSLVRKVSRLAR